MINLHNFDSLEYALYDDYSEIYLNKQGLIMNLENCTKEEYEDYWKSLLQYVDAFSEYYDSLFEYRSDFYYEDYLADWKNGE